MLRGVRVFGAVLMLCVLVASACGGSTAGTAPAGSVAPTSAAPKPPLVLGVTLPLTGQTAGFGKPSQQGVILAIEELNKAGGVNGQDIKAVYEDFADDTAKAVTGLQKLESVDKVSVVISGSTGPILAQGPVANRDHVVLVNGGAGNPAIRALGAGGYFFSVLNDANEEARDVLRYVKNVLKVNEAVMIYTSDAIGDGNRGGFELAAKEFGVNLTATVVFDPKSHDYRAQIAKLQELKPKTVIVGVWFEPMGFVLKQAAEMSLSTSWVGLQMTTNPETLTVAGRGAEGYLTTRPSFDSALLASGDNATKRFAAAYKARFNEAPTVYSAHYYSATQLIVKVVKETGSFDATTIAAGLRKYNDTNPFQGAAGPIAFDKDGMVHQPGTIFRVQNGTLVPIN